VATIVADTSFLFSLFGNDVQTAAAHRWVVSARQPITVSMLNRFEFGNAIRFAAFRKAISQADALGSLATFETDLKNGNLRLVSCDLTAVVTESARLSEIHTLNGGIGRSIFCMSRRRKCSRRPRF
jgi:predicted nucleic acid-binding protein